jgi:uncharacterized protein
MSETGNAAAPQFRQLNLEEITAILGPVDRPVRDKIKPRLGATARRFIAHSPFLTLATCGRRGADSSPRGDGPGFVKVLDPNTLSVPDRAGNALADSFRNILENPQVGLLFLVPGLRETLRVNGTGYITDDLDLRRRHELDGRVPNLALIVRVREAYFHCGKSLIRSRMWDPSSRVDPFDVVLGSNVFSLTNIEERPVELSSNSLSAALESSYVSDL